MFNNIRGIIAFEAVAPEPEAFINDIRQSMASVKDLRCKDGRISGKLYGSDLPVAERIAEKNGVQISVSDRYGGIFTVRRYKLRAGIIAGILLALLMTVYLSNIVMSIEVYGNETLTDKQIESLLNDCGIRIGAFIPSIDLREAEMKIISSSDNIAWIGIRSSGCIVQAEVSEMTKPPEMTPTSVPCNIVSSKDAQIVAIRNVHMGMLIPMLYDGVKKGDILISGTVEDGRGGVYFAHAMGEIIGRYDEKVCFYQPYTEENLVYTDKITRKALDVFGLKIPLYVGKNDFGQCEYDESRSFLQLLGINLPIAVLRSEYRIYETETEEYTSEKARRLLEDRIKLYEMNFYVGEDITVEDKEVQISENKDGMTAVVKYVLEGDIGITREIMAK